MTFKAILYLGLGFASLAPFGLRFLLQWVMSERRGESYVTSLFWILSIIGNILISAHYLAQIQFHLYVIRFFPLYFSFRQLALIKGYAKPFSWSRLLKILSFLSLSLTLLFVLRVWIEHHKMLWISHLEMPWSNINPNISFVWHSIGFLGAAIFASRLWVQWWQSERTQKSFLSPSFWWLSLSGGSLTLFYAVFIKDYVTACGYITGLVPYARNLMLIYKSKQKATN
ncbi:MAG: hypothetical protein S4CHLAM7_11490 [Chlamydiae bacterium]|nr:hypothetical protein [Chlamydiota bacterium]